MSNYPEEPEVLIEKVQSTGVIAMNRPRALNAHSIPMLSRMYHALEQWEDEAIEQVLVKSTNPRFFCAGGDVRAIRQGDMHGDYDTGRNFFIHEYRTDRALRNYSRPVISLIEGVVMGGGLGVSAHGDYRVITEHSFAAMPETAIGFVPDAGMSYGLTHLFPHKTRGTAFEESELLDLNLYDLRRALGIFLGTTGWRLTPADMMWTGLGTHKIHSSQAREWEKVLYEQGIDQALAFTEQQRFSEEEEDQSALAQNYEWILEVFGQRRWSQIQKTLEQYRHSHPDNEFICQVLSLLDQANPTSLIATTELLERTSRSSFDEALSLELAVGTTLRQQPNFIEGVRAVLVEKDKQAKFSPGTLDEVDESWWEEYVQSYPTTPLPDPL